MGRVVASLTRRFGDLDLAEEAAAEAFATAVERWRVDGVPPNPGAWLITTARHKAIDRIRRENKREDTQKEAHMLYDDDPPEPVGAIDDERLRLIFTCCHPALAMQTRVALTLRMVGGLTVAEIARAFLVQETAMGQRITRAKAKIKAARIPIGCRPRRSSRHASPAYSPSSSSSSTRAIWRPAPTPIPYATT
jgi:RNA polymerase sigma-70 factor, ECF subfamily